mgnify:FL=1
MKLHERYSTLEALPESAPVFPLRGAILLPRAGLPLNIFEPRYLAMFDDALKTDRLIAIVQPDLRQMETDPRVTFAAADSPAGSVPLRQVATLGRIMAFQELDDGRMIVSLAGITRCTLGRETTSGTLYRRFAITAADYAADLVPGAGESEVPREELLAALKAYLAARNLNADWSQISRLPNEPLVNSLAVMSPYGPEEKQALLEAKTLRERAEILIALAQMELASGGSESGSTLQ